MLDWHALSAFVKSPDKERATPYGMSLPLPQINLVPFFLVIDALYVSQCFTLQILQIKLSHDTVKFSFNPLEIWDISCFSLLRWEMVKLCYHDPVKSKHILLYIYHVACGVPRCTANVTAAMWVKSRESPQTAPWEKRSISEYSLQLKVFFRGFIGN